MSFFFESPNWLWLALVAPLVAFVPRRAPDRFQALLRIVVVLLVVVALARPASWRADATERTVIVLDESGSVEPTSRDRAREAVARLVASATAQKPVTLVTLGDASAGVDAGATPRAAAHVARRVGEHAGPSSLSAALDEAARALPVASRGSILLLTDGESTDAHHGDALVDLQRRGIPVHVTELARAPRAPTPVQFACEEEWVTGTSATLAVDVAGNARDVSVRLVGPEGEIARRDGLDVDGVTRVEFEHEAPAEPFVALEAHVVSNGVTSTMRRTFAVQPPRRVLYWGGRVRGAGARLRDVLGPGFAWEEASASDATTTLAAVRARGAHDLIVIDDVPAAALGDLDQDAIAASVEQAGTGLLVTGGESAFGPGGYADAPLARILPVECIQKEEKRDPSTTLALIIDTSGSMGGERIQLAKEVARLAMTRLLPHDKVGIVEFYGAKRWAAPIQPASNSIELQRAINRMDAGGGTVILPAIEEAYYGLQNVDTRYKHVLVLTDGGVENGAFEPLLRRMAEEGITVSTVLIGPEAHSEFLVDIANWGKGRFYSAPDRFNLPEILLKQPTSSRLPAYKPGSFPLAARGGEAWWGRVDRGNVPPVAGYVETSARPGAEVLLEIAGERDPLLATWCAGLGRVTALTTEPAGPGTESWRAWSDYGRFLARVAARTSDEDRTGFSFRLERRGDVVEVRASRTVADVSTRELTPRATRLAADGQPGGALTFERRGPGEFVSRLRVPANEALFLACTSDAPAAPLVRRVSDAHEDVRAETQVDPRSALDLARVAAVTGGDVVSLDASSTFLPRAGGASSAESLVSWTPFAVAAALLVWLFEIFHRRRDRRGANT